MRVAYFGFPNLGGTFQVFRQLRAGLRPLGVTVQWVGTGGEAHDVLADPRWAAEMGCGFVVGGRNSAPEVCARQLAQALDAATFDAVFVSVLADVVQTNLVRYLPPHLLRIMIVHSITPGTYGAAHAIRDHVHATVAISPRIRDDLLRRHSFAADRIVTIPHAVDPDLLCCNIERRQNDALRLLYLGRIEDQSKGVLLLPRILSRLPEHITLTVAGDGPDLAKLKRRCRKFGERVRFLGAVQYENAPALLADHHVMVMPSRFEGFGLTLIEAMAAGCVPVVARIRGVTDWIVKDGHDGSLFPPGSSAKAARRIIQLDRDRGRLDEMSRAARRSSEVDYTRAAMAASYHRLLKQLRSDPPSISAPLDLATWEMPGGLRAGLRTRLPKPVKNLLRQLKESIA